MQSQSNIKLRTSLDKISNSFAKSKKHMENYIDTKQHRNSVLIKELEEAISQVAFELRERKKIINNQRTSSLTTNLLQQPQPRPAAQPQSRPASQPKPLPASQPQPSFAAMPASSAAAQPASRFAAQPKPLPAAQPQPSFAAMAAFSAAAQPQSSFAAMPASSATAQPQSRFAAMPAFSTAAQPQSRFAAMPASSAAAQTKVSSEKSRAVSLKNSNEFRITPEILQFYNLEWNIPHSPAYEYKMKTESSSSQMYVLKFFRNEFKIEFSDLKEYTLSEISKKLYDQEIIFGMDMIRYTVDWIFPIYNNTYFLKKELNIPYIILQIPKILDKEYDMLIQDYFCAYNYFNALQVYLLNFGFKLNYSSTYNQMQVELKNPNFDLKDFHYFAYLKDNIFVMNDVILYTFIRIAISMKLMGFTDLIITLRFSINQIKVKIIERKLIKNPLYIIIGKMVDLLEDIILKIKRASFEKAEAKTPFRIVKSMGNDDFYKLEKQN
jgi:hypothetical protein